MYKWVRLLYLIRIKSQCDLPTFFNFFFLLFISSPDESTVSYVRSFRVMYVFHSVVLHMKTTWTDIQSPREHGAPPCSGPRIYFIVSVGTFVTSIRFHSLSCARNLYSGERQFASPAVLRMKAKCEFQR